MVYFLIALLIVAVLLLIFTYFVFKSVFGPRKERDPREVPKNEQYQAFKDETVTMVTALMERPFEKVEIISHDALMLRGRWYKGEEDKPTAILFHGYRGSAYRDFCGGSALLFEKDWNVLLVDERSHGMSEGKAITFGIKEKYDVSDWVRYIEERRGKDKGIYLFGISMGAATVLMASSLLDKSRVRGIIADCPYSSPEKIIAKVMKDIKLVPALLMPFVKLSTLIWGRFSLDTVSASEAVENSDIPILIIHGEDDRFVPDYMSREIYEANPKLVRYETFPNAGHGLSFMVDNKRYRMLVDEFFSSLGD